MASQRRKAPPSSRTKIKTGRRGKRGTTTDTHVLVRLVASKPTLVLVIGVLTLCCVVFFRATQDLPTSAILGSTSSLSGEEATAAAPVLRAAAVAAAAIQTAQEDHRADTAAAAASTSTLTMADWRTSVQKLCTDVLTRLGDQATTSTALALKETLEKKAIQQFALVTAPSSIGVASEKPYRYCTNAFIDLGTNIGDSIGYFIDNALDVCSRLWIEKHRNTQYREQTFPRPHLNVSTLQVEHVGNGANPLYGTLQSLTTAGTQSESFCVYGMEGNPEFTPRLTKLTNYVMGMSPRPVQHLHIFTESVITAVDGPTKLYLDKTSVAENFWGSSILSSQQDAVKSAKLLNEGTVMSADVQGITLSTMVSSTMRALQATATADEQTGGTLIIKMDVEGAEYQVLKEVAASGILCHLIDRGNTVIMIVEFHNMSITDPTERRREKDGAEAAKQKLAACGVKFQRLQAHWH